MNSLIRRNEQIANLFHVFFLSKASKLYFTWSPFRLPSTTQNLFKKVFVEVGWSEILMNLANDFDFEDFLGLILLFLSKDDGKMIILVQLTASACFVSGNAWFTVLLNYFGDQEVWTFFPLINSVPNGNFNFSAKFRKLHPRSAELSR